MCLQDCKTAKCVSIKCVVKDMTVKSHYFVNVTARIWNGTFASVRAQLVFLSLFIYAGLLYGTVCVCAYPDWLIVCVDLFFLVIIWVCSKSTFQTLELTTTTEIETSQPDLLIIGRKKAMVTFTLWHKPSC